MAKNYTYGWKLKEAGYTEVPETEYTLQQKEHQDFIKALSDVVIKADCGWDGLEYKVMRKKVDNTSSITVINERIYMVLVVGDQAERWIPIEGNSKACNLQVLGENIF